MRIYVTGDTHGSIDMDKLNTKNFPEQKGLTKDDLIIIAGDFGHIWYPPEHRRHKEDKYWLNEYFNKSKKFTTAFIDGNHENFCLLNDYPIELWNGGKIHRINDSVIHLMRGQVYTVNGTRIFTFGGAKSLDRLHRTIGIDWWAEEEPSYAELEEGLDALDKHDWKVDYVISHTASDRVKDMFVTKYGFKKEKEVLNSYFDMLEQKLDYRHWFFGHYHLDENIDDKTTTLYNSIKEINI